MVTLPTARRGRYSSGEQTRALLIETAERLFARSGYEGITLADIRGAARQGNASVIRYYFGSKEDLLRAVFEHRLPAISAERTALMAASEPGGLSTRDALWALVRPLVSCLEKGFHYVGLLDRLLDAGILADAFATADPSLTASARIVDDAMRAALPGIPEDVRGVRIRMVYESALRTLARYDRAGTAPTRDELAMYVDAWEGMLRAPAPQHP
ncbi:TetR/AcrR family transcriptional regulator [Rhodococcus triatomae]|nr:tetr family transcriptional regulator [Rhodococcus triatomae BKS 15-14]